MEKSLLDKNVERIVLPAVGDEMLQFLEENAFSLYGCRYVDNEFGNFLLDYKNDKICIKIINDRSDMMVELGMSNGKKFFYIGYMRVLGQHR